jgi:hypothetical protein
MFIFPLTNMLIGVIGSNNNDEESNMQSIAKGV